jgi:hypothetical protein
MESVISNQGVFQRPVRVVRSNGQGRNNARKEVQGYCWIGNDRLLVLSEVWDAFYGALAVDWNGARPVPISGYEDNQIVVSGPKAFYRELVYASFDEDGTVLMLDRHTGGAGNPNRPDRISGRK